MTIAQLFSNLAEYHNLKAEFSESLEALYSLEFEESGLVIRDILNKRYPDGITGLEAVKIEGNSITGIFLDQISPTVTKKFNFTINSDSGEVAYDQIDTGNLDYSEVSFATKKNQSCTKGKSSACTREDGTIYCIPIGRKCNTGKRLDSVETKAIKEIVAKATKAPKQPKGSVKQVQEKAAKTPKQTKSSQDQHQFKSKKQLKDSKINQKEAGTPEEVKTQSDFTVSKSPSDITKFAEKWSDTFVDGLEKDYSPEVQAKLLDGLTIFGGISSAAEENNGEDKFLVLKDKKGIEQSAASYKKDEANKALYIDYLATAPWNITGGDSKSTKGAGTEAIISLIKESQASGYEGKLTLTPTPKAEAFYAKLGFKEALKKDDDSELNWELTIEKANELLKKLGR